jgi:hypothetical protein
VQKITRLLIAAFFAAIIFITRLFVPPPISQLLVAVDAILLGLSSLFVKKFGASYVGLVSGVLMGLLAPALLPFSIIFAFLYGVIVDASLFLFKVRATEEGVNRNRMMIAMAFATLLIAVISYYSTVFFLIPLNQMISMLVVFFGPASGIAAGYATSYLWNKYLKPMTV